MRYKRIIAKFGTNLLTGGTGRLDLKVMTSLVDQVTRLHKAGHEVIIVSSGAVAAGRQVLDLPSERKDIAFKQVLASVGQTHLIQAYEQLFKWQEIIVAQALLTRADIADRTGYLNARNTLLALIELGVICVANENDVVATDELGEARFGDNDNLSAMVANLVDADLLAILTDIDGLCTADPQQSSDAKLIPKVEEIDAEIEQLATHAAGSHGVGGMATKVEAAKLATASGVTVVIANGLKSETLVRIAGGEEIGTLFPARASKIESKKRWMLSGLASKGRLVVDEGAVEALKKQNRSLLPAGVVDVEGTFSRGDVVDIFDPTGRQIGSGIPNYCSRDIEAIKGGHSQAIAEQLGYEYGTEVIHRNNMVLI